MTVRRASSNQRSDHFAVVGRGAQSRTNSRAALSGGCKRVFGPPFRIGDTELRINAKAGIALFPNDGSDADTLFRNAESALKEGEIAGRTFICFYTAQMTSASRRSWRVENKLRRAWRETSFILHYQPKVDLERRRMSGRGADPLASPELGLVPPLQFHSAAGRDRVDPAGRLLGAKAGIADHRQLGKQGSRRRAWRSNVSPIQLRSASSSRSSSTRSWKGWRRRRSTWRSAESLIMGTSRGTSRSSMPCVRSASISRSTNFGTGYSSLGYLAKLPVQSLKIDRSFIAAMHEDANAMTLVSTIVSLAHSLRLKVVAEGVETEEQAKILRLLKCDEMQGYLFSKPLPIAALVELLRKSS